MPYICYTLPVKAGHIVVMAKSEIFPSDLDPNVI